MSILKFFSDVTFPVASIFPAGVGTRDKAMVSEWRVCVHRFSPHVTSVRRGLRLWGEVASTVLTSLKHVLHIPKHSDITLLCGLQGLSIAKKKDGSERERPH